MTNYHTPTVVQPTIPVADMTELEFEVLTEVFQWERSHDGKSIYFYSDEGPTQEPEIRRETLADALSSMVTRYITPLTHHVKAALEQTDGEYVYLDIDWRTVLQDIVARSKTLKYVAAIESYTCDKMRPDGWGGGVTFITATEIKEMSTNQVLDQWVKEAA